MRKIFIIQHCQSEHHINNMTGGWTDTPLTEKGRRQASLIGPKLCEYNIQEEEFTLYSSDLLRASQTAEIIAGHLNTTVNLNADLREINCGVATGKTREWANENRNPRKTNTFELDYQEFPEGETWRQFYNRVSTCMNKIYQTSNKNLVIVTHGGALSYIIAWWLQLHTEQLSNTYFAGNPGSISILTENKYNQRVLKLFNDTSHLLELNHE